MNIIARNLLLAYYEETFQPLNDPEFAEREDADHPCPSLTLVRMLTRTADGGMMQAVATIGASQRVLPREQGGGEARNEYVIFLPAHWNLEDEAHMWVMDFMADLADYTFEVDRPLTYGHRIDMYSDAPDYLPADVNMTGCVLMEPFGGARPEAVACRTGLFSNVSLIQAMPVTAQEMQMDFADLMDAFYPATGEVRCLCARSR